MARVSREKSETGIYHVMMRGINKEIIFNDEEDKHRFIWILKKYKELNKYTVYSYCLMDNHVHILIKESEDDISNAIKRISSSYVWWYNNKYERIGHLFQARFKSEVVNSDRYLLTVMRYIHKNPVKANMVSNLNQYQWSSYNEYIGKENIVDREWVLALFSNKKENSLELFKDYHRENDDNVYLDISNDKYLTDKEVKNLISKLNIDIDEIKNLNRENRDALLKELKAINGSSIRQISRITGISKSVIGRI